MKIGDRVAVCYDGKVGRAVEGVVTGTRQVSRIRVKFNTWTDGELVEAWFPRRQRPVRYGGRRYTYGKFVQVTDSLMDKLMGSGGDWYAVYKMSDLDDWYKNNMKKFSESVDL